MGNISDSIIESVNKVGSLANGPILAMFLLGILTKSGNEKGAISGLLVGLITNACLWIFVPHISWFWWNLLGFMIAFNVGVIVSTVTGGTDKDLSGLVWEPGVVKAFNYAVNWPKRYAIMIAYAVLMITFCATLGMWAYDGNKSAQAAEVKDSGSDQVNKGTKTNTDGEADTSVKSGQDTKVLKDDITKRAIDDAGIDGKARTSDADGGNKTGANDIGVGDKTGKPNAGSKVDLAPIDKAEAGDTPREAGTNGDAGTNK